MIDGFATIQEQTGLLPAAISFCFPGPADYANGIIGDLENLPHFKGGGAQSHVGSPFQMPGLYQQRR